MPEPDSDFGKSLRQQSFFATKPTRFTRFLRTCIPWQMIRFAFINLRMIQVIRRSHH
ncbi:MAG: hypothetical protein LWX11_02855 [Firmicutes bacterium]|nr:hypothetical protein [Bacillota bacterium]